jgi:transposase
MTKKNISSKACVNKDIVVVTDYHAEKIEFRVRNLATDKERRFNRDTLAQTIEDVLSEALAEARSQGGGVVWIMESTTGWARVKKLLQEKRLSVKELKFVVVNVLQLPLPPRAYRRKTDKLDTKRLMREYVNGELPEAYQPEAGERSRRRVVCLREDLVRRQTSVRNKIKAHLAQELWVDAENLWSMRGMKKLKAIVLGMNEDDRFAMDLRIRELESLAKELTMVESRLMRFCEASADAKALDKIPGLGPVSAVSIVERIGSIDRFKNAESLIGFAGLAPGVRSSDSTSRNLSIGGGGTDKYLRHYLIEAAKWTRKIERYRQTYERVENKRGRKIARIVVARLTLRSIHKMLSEGVEFDPGAREVREAKSKRCA